MASTIVTPSGITPAQAAEPLLQPFNRFREAIDSISIEGRVLRRFAEEVADVVNGVRSIMVLALDDEHRAELRADNDEPSEEDRPLVSASDLWSMRRLGVRALEMLDREAYVLMDWAFDHHTPEGRAVKQQAQHASASATPAEPPLQPEEMTGWRADLYALAQDVAGTIREAVGLDPQGGLPDLGTVLEHAQGVCDTLLQEIADHRVSADGFAAHTYELMALLRAAASLDDTPRAVKLSMQEARSKLDAATNEGGILAVATDEDPGYIRQRGGQP